MKKSVLCFFYLWLPLFATISFGQTPYLVSDFHAAHGFENNDQVIF